MIEVNYEFVNDILCIFNQATFGKQPDWNWSTTKIYMGVKEHKIVSVKNGDILKAG